MGLRFRKSINLGGGFRINFSKSGVGYSFGGKGFRYTKTARGTTRTTVSVPGTGISWVEESGKRKESATNNAKPSAGPIDSAYLYSVENDSEIVSADFETFLVAIKHFLKIDKIFSIIPFVALFGFVVGTVQTAADDSPALLLFSTLVFLGAIIGKIVYRVIGPVKATYDLESPEGKYRVEHLQHIMDCLKDCSMLWQVNDVYLNNSTRRHGGAGQSVQLTKIKIQRRKPFFLRTNAKMYYVKLKKEKLYILPDVIIVKGKKGIGAAALKDLEITVTDTRFVANVAPKDATILSYTWQFVNNNGTPDKRFKNNRQLPVCLYGLIDLKTDGGLHTRLYLSNAQKAQEFRDIAAEMIEHAEGMKNETAVQE